MYIYIYIYVYIYIYGISISDSIIKLIALKGEDQRIINLP